MGVCASAQGDVEGDFTGVNDHATKAEGAPDPDDKLGKKTGKQGKKSKKKKSANGDADGDADGPRGTPLQRDGSNRRMQRSRSPVKARKRPIPSSETPGHAGSETPSKKDIAAKIMRGEFSSMKNANGNANSNSVSVDAGSEDGGSGQVSGASTPRRGRARHSRKKSGGSSGGKSSRSGSGSDSLVSAEQERETITKLEATANLAKNRVVGQAYCLIDMHWWREWISYAKFKRKAKARRGMQKTGGHRRTGSRSRKKKKSGSDHETDDDDEDSYSNAEDNDNAPRPGEIDNSPLLVDTEISQMSQSANGDVAANEDPDAVHLRPNLVRDNDFVLVCEASFDKLQQWYGGGPKITRKMIQLGVHKDLVVEMYPLRVQIALLKDPKKCPAPKEWLSLETTHKNKDQAENDGKGQKGRKRKKSKKDSGSNLPAMITVVSSRTALLSELKLQICRQLKITAKRARLWEIDEDGQTYDQIADLRSSLESLNVIDNQVIIVEERDAKGNWNLTDHFEHIKAEVRKRNKLLGSMTPRGKNRKDLELAFLQKDNEENGRKQSIIVSLEPDRGLTGIRNLGNTCFLNSAVQCLGHTSPFVDAFLTGAYKSDINRNNPLGMSGNLADEFNRLVRAIWASNSNPITPKQFLRVIGKYAPRFMSYQQQDAQELLSFLLDGLHEDLNRVEDKTYVQEEDHDPDRDHDDLAAESWQRHLARNDSMVVDLFHGQYRSSLVCPTCQLHSLRFDPMAYMSLPLPSERYRSLIVCLVRDNGAESRKLYRLQLAKKGTVLDLKSALSKQCGIPTRNLVVADVYQHRIYRYLMNKDKLSGIRKRDDIYVYEVVRFESDKKKKKKKKKKDANANAEDETPEAEDQATKVQSVYISVSYHLGNGRGKFGTPILLSLHGGSLPYSKLYMMLVDKLHMFLRAPSDDSRVTGKPFPFVPQVKEERALYNEDTLTMLAQPIHPVFEVFHSRDGQLCPALTEEELDGVFNQAVVGNGQRIDPEVDLSDGHPIALMWQKKVIAACMDLEEENTVEAYDETLQPSEITLDSCLKLFTKTEVLGADDQWHCPSCKDWRRASKQIDLWHLPEILTVHLKRFSYEQHYDYREKLTNMVEFPLENLDMTPYVKGKRPDGSPSNVKYDLFAVCNHYGQAGGGHYTAIVKMENASSPASQWVEFDDDVVSPVRVDQVQSSAAYVLFYKAQPQQDSQ